MKLTLAVFAVAVFAATCAHAQTPRPRIQLPVDPLHLNTPAANSAETVAPDIISKIQSVALADLQAASADAKATGDTIASGCYDAWITLITAQQTAQGVAMPDPHIITLFQRNRDLVNALRPGSPMKVACSPLAEELKQDVVSLLGKIAGGALTLPALLAPFGL